VVQKTLTRHLREKREEDVLAHREVYREVPPKVEYPLAERGISHNEALASSGNGALNACSESGPEKGTVDGSGAAQR
jgi:DNA-binding HxlR family transcriptional regulator